jgi:hypothetical protein
MPAPEKRLYMNVHPYRHKKTHQTIGWVAKLWVDGIRRTVGGIHETQQLAAAAAARVRKVPLQDLRLQQPQPRRRRGAAGVSSVVQQSSNPRAGRKRKGLQPSSRPSSGAAGVSSIVRQSSSLQAGRKRKGAGRKRKGLQPSPRPRSGAAGVSSVVQQSGDPAPEKRLYKHVHYRKQNNWGKSGWVAQVSIDGVQRTVGGVHKTQQLAAATAARVLKVPLQELRLQQPLPVPSSGAAGVSNVVQQSSSPQADRKRKGLPRAPILKKYVYKQGRRFRVAVGEVYVGSFATAAEAGAAAAEYAEQHGLEKELKDQKVKPRELLDRLKIGLKVFKGYEPPDLQNLAEEIKLSSSLWQSEPALPFLCALGKYGPWRAKLRARAQTWFSPGKPPARLQDLPSRTARLLDILKGTVEDMQTTAKSLDYRATVYLEFSTSSSQGLCQNAGNMFFSRTVATAHIITIISLLLILVVPHSISS